MNQIETHIYISQLIKESCSVSSEVRTYTNQIIAKIQNEVKTKYSAKDEYHKYEGNFNIQIKNKRLVIAYFVFDFKRNDYLEEFKKKTDLDCSFGVDKNGGGKITVLLSSVYGKINTLENIKKIGHETEHAYQWISSGCPMDFSDKDFFDFIQAEINSCTQIRKDIASCLYLSGKQEMDAQIQEASFDLEKSLSPLTDIYKTDVYLTIKFFEKKIDLIKNIDNDFINGLYQPYGLNKQKIIKILTKSQKYLSLKLGKILSVYFPQKPKI